MEAINIKNLRKIFGSFVAVDDISLAIEKGEIFAFLGPNGAGKTTTIKMLTTLLDPTSGSLLVNGFDTEKQSDDVRRSFGIVFQDQSLDDELTAYENIDFHGVLYGLDKPERRKRCEEMLRFVELWDRRKELVRNFSGGMRRRLEIARGLLHYPDIFFLDEPTLGLDPQTRNHIWEYIKKLNKERNLTVFFTTHYMDEAERYADRIAIIDNGKIIADGSPEELKSKTGFTTIEEAFLSLTGKNIREEALSSAERSRMQKNTWRRK